jgi:MFS family permease
VRTFLSEVDDHARKALLAGFLGWMLDGMDIMLFAMVMPYIVLDLGLNPSTGGALASVTLIASAVGGALFGVLADRIGRTRALMASILMYSLFTAACGLARGVTDLVIFRFLLGLGMGGEWASGAALISETWPKEHRGKALALMQSSWAIGYAIAAAITALVLPRFGWRPVFFVGVLPALLTFWIRRSVPEPQIWVQRHDHQTRSWSTADLFRVPFRRHVLVTASMNGCAQFAWWGLFTWIPTFLALPLSRGGAGLNIVETSTWVILMQAGMWVGYVSFGFFSDRVGRKSTYVCYLLIAALLVPVYGATRDASKLLVIGPLVAFFGTGHFSGFGVITAELFPTAIRATAQGFTYNIGRAGAALAPYIVGFLGQTYGLGFAFTLSAVGFLAATMIAWLALPETKGTELV